MMGAAARWLTAALRGQETPLPAPPPAGVFTAKVLRQPVSVRVMTLFFLGRE